MLIEGTLPGHAPAHAPPGRVDFKAKLSGLKRRRQGLAAALPGHLVAGMRAIGQDKSPMHTDIAGAMSRPQGLRSPEEKRSTVFRELKKFMAQIEIPTPEPQTHMMLYPLLSGLIIHLCGHGQTPPEAHQQMQEAALEHVKGRPLKQQTPGFCDFKSKVPRPAPMRSLEVLLVCGFRMNQGFQGDDGLKSVVPPQLYRLPRLNRVPGAQSSYPD